MRGSDLARGGPVTTLHPTQRSVLEEYKKATSASTVTRQPSAGRKPPQGKTVLPEFPRRPSGNGSYGAAGASGRSTSVPRPSSRTVSGPTNGAGYASGGPAAGAAGVPSGSHQSPRGATRAAVTPGSILDSLKTPSVLSGGSMASLAQRMNSSSGWDYSTLAGASTTSSLRLKRQAIPGGELSGSLADNPGSPITYAAQYHASTLPPAGGDQLRAVYLSGPATGTSAPMGAATTPGTPGTSMSGLAPPGRRPSADRTSLERAMSRASSFSSSHGGGASAGGMGTGGLGAPSAPPLPVGAADTQSSSQYQPQRLAPGAVYASQYAHQYGNAASTVYIPYSSQHGAAAAGAAAPSAPPAPSAYGAVGGAQVGAVHISHERTVGAGGASSHTHYLGGTAAGMVSRGRSSSSSIGGTTSHVPSYLPSSTSPSGAVPSAPPLGTSSGQASSSQGYHPPSGPSGSSSSAGLSHLPAAEYGPARVQQAQRARSNSPASSLSRPAGPTSASGAPSAPPLPHAGPTASVGSRLRTLSIATEDEGPDGGGGGGGGGSNTSLRRLQEEPRRSGTGIASPSGAAGGSLGSNLSPKSAAAGGSSLPSAPLLPTAAMDPHQAAAQQHQQQHSGQYHYHHQQHQTQHQQHQHQHAYYQQQQQPQNASHPQAHLHAHAHAHHQTQQPQHPHPQQPYSTGMSTGAALESGGSSYTSTSSAKSSVAIAGTPGGGVSSASTSRTTSSISQRSVADGQGHQSSAAPAATAAPSAPPLAAGGQHAAAGGRSGVAASHSSSSASSCGVPSASSSVSSHDSDVRSSSEAPSAPVAPHGRAGSTGAGALVAVCGPLPDLPVVAAPRDLQPGRGCVGLQNLGNTCFMNSILQSLHAVPELVQQFLSPSERNWSSKAVVAPAYSGLVRDMMAGSLGGCVNPSAFLRKVSKHDGRWGDGRQQDSQEFLNSLLEVLQSECNRIACKPVYKELAGKGPEEDQAAEAFAYARTWNDSIVDDIFGGLTQSTIQCHACNRLSHTFEPFLGLAVPIPSPGGAGAGNGDREGVAAAAAGGGGSVSVADCLRAFVECEELEGEDSYKCEACKRRQPHSKRLQIFRPPRVLVLTLKRFAQRPAAPGFFSRFRSPAKNNTPVRLEPEPLDLAPYCNPLGLRGLCVRGRPGAVSPVYELVAVSHHSGSLDGGHYTAQARSCLDGQWYNFNDSSVRREAARPCGASSSAYVLFYRLATLQPSSL